MRLNKSNFTRPRKAVALQYDGLGAPKLTAKGNAEIADRIVELAKEHDIPLYESPELAAALSYLDLGAEIPEVLYMAIAEVLAFIYDLDTIKAKTQPQD